MGNTTEPAKILPETLATAADVAALERFNLVIEGGAVLLVLAAGLLVRRWWLRRRVIR